MARWVIFSNVRHIVAIDKLNDDIFLTMILMGPRAQAFFSFAYNKISFQTLFHNSFFRLSLMYWTVAKSDRVALELALPLMCVVSIITEYD